MKLSKAEINILKMAARDGVYSSFGPTKPVRDLIEADLLIVTGHVFDVKITPAGRAALEAEGG